jgi:hypothetical protein
MVRIIVTTLVAICAALNLSAAPPAEPDTNHAYFDPTYTTGSSIGHCATGPRQYTITWPDSVSAWYGRLQLRSSDTSPWIDCWNLGLGEFNDWQYNNNSLVITDKYNNVDPQWQYRLILW